MTRISRRTLLAGVTTTVVASTAGCVGTEEDEQGDDPAEENGGPAEGDGWKEEISLPSSLIEVFEFLYEPDDEELVISVVRPDDDSDSPPEDEPVRLAAEVPDWVVSFEFSGSTSIIATAEFDADDPEEWEAGATTEAEFTVYNIEDGSTVYDDEVVATDGDILLRGERAWVEQTLDRHYDGTEPYLADRPDILRVFELLDIEANAIVTDSEEILREDFDEEELGGMEIPDVLGFGHVQGEETIEMTTVGWYEDGVDDEMAAEFERFSETAFGIEDGDVEVTTDEYGVTVTGSQSYTPPEERPDPPGVPRFKTYDAETDEVLFEFVDGETLPAEHFELQLNDEPYEGDWTHGQDEIGPGTIVGLSADAVEPGDSMRITYENPEHGLSGGMGTTVLRNLPISFTYDPDERRGELEYVDGPPLPADRIEMYVEGTVQNRTEQLSSDLAAGDTVLLEDVALDGDVIVEYERSDGQSVTLQFAIARPPGRFDFEYDGEREQLAVIYPELEPVPADSGRRRNVAVDIGAPPADEPLDADRYEVRVDGEATEEQLADLGETVEPGDELVLTGIEVDSTVTVVWLGQNEEYEIGRQFIVPDAEFEFEYDDGKITVRHAGGQSFDAERASVIVHGREKQQTTWETDIVEQGDEVVVETSEDHGFVQVRYDNRSLDRVQLAELREE